jgi:membrane protease YdiL (CAAX protease family)
VGLAIPGFHGLGVVIAKRRADVLDGMAFVRRHPVLSFFVLAFGVTWLAWSPYVLSLNGVGLLRFRIPVVLGSAQTIGLLPGAYLGPVSSAFLVTALADGRPGLRRWAGRLIRWNIAWPWYVGVIAGVPLVLIGTTFLLPAAWGHFAAPTLGLLLGYLPFLVLQTLTTGVAEEPGWRDFVLPRLQDRYGPLVGTLILGPLWGAWHLPLFFTEWAGWPDVDWLMAVEFVVSAVPLSLVMTWVFNRTGQSLPIVMLLHAGVNATFSLPWPALFPTLDAWRDSLHVQLIASTAAAISAIAFTRGSLGWDHGRTRSGDASDARPTGTDRRGTTLAGVVAEADR